MTTKTFQAWSAGCGTAIVLRLVITIGVLLVMTVCMGTAALVPLPRDVDRQFVILGAFLLAVFGTVAAAIVVAFGMLRQRGRRLDAAFAPLNIAGRAYLTNGRQYHGRYRGRQVDAYFSRGPLLELYLGTPLQTRLGFARRDGVGRAVAGFLGRPPLAVDEPRWASQNIWVLDERWGRAVLAEPRIHASVQRLMDEGSAGAGRFEIRQLILQPEAWLLRLQYTRVDNINAGNVSAWLDDLHALAEAAEALPSPQTTLAPTTLERNARANRGAFVLPSVLIVLGLMGGLLVCSLFPAFVLMLSGQ